MSKNDTWMVIAIALGIVGFMFGIAIAKVNHQNKGDKYCYPFQVFGFGQDGKPVCASHLPREDYDE